jgi:type IV pilus biogenesis protein PilP
MPESGKIRSGNRGLIAGLTILFLVACTGAGWWAWTVKARSSPRPVVTLVPESVLKKSSASTETNDTAPANPAMADPPASHPQQPVPIRVPVSTSLAAQTEQEALDGNATTPADIALSGQNSAPDAIQLIQAGEISEPGVIHEFSRLRTELERKKLQVEIARQDQELRDLQFATFSPVIEPEPALVRPKPPRVPPRVVSIYGRGNDLQAVIDQPGTGQQTVRLGDLVEGAPVMGISGDGVVIGTGPQKRTLGFK